MVEEALGGRPWKFRSSRSQAVTERMMAASDITLRQPDLSEPELILRSRQRKDI
jgi:hypothetical protein